MLWVLSRISGRVGYDEFDGHVVRAPNAKKARQLVAEMTYGDEGSGTWLDEKLSSCEKLSGRGKMEIILSSFNAG